MTSDSKYYSIGTLEKAFSVIDVMVQKADWELGELSTVCKIPKGTLQRILLTLASLGYVQQRMRGGSYSLTLQFLQLGRRVAANSTLLGDARPFCRQLMETINETVNLCMPMHTDMVVADQFVSQQMLRLDSIVGSSFPILRSASGKVWCAFLDGASREKILQEILLTNRGINYKEIEKFEVEIAQAQRVGVAFDFEEIFAGVRCVAAPIFGMSGDIVATLGISVPTVRITEASARRMRDAVMDTAGKISQRLGAPQRYFAPTDTTFNQGL